MKIKTITVRDSGVEEKGFIVRLDYINGYHIENVPGGGTPLAMGSTDILRMVAWLHNLAEDQQFASPMENKTNANPNE